MRYTINCYIICKYGEIWYASKFFFRGGVLKYFSTLTVIRNV